MRITVQVLHTESWQNIADIVLPNLWKYCDRHGYKLVVGEGMGFDKLEGVKLLFENTNCDIVWVLDLDTLVTNHQIPLERFLDEYHDCFITKDVNGINCGSFLIQKSYWSEMFIDWMLAQKGKDGMNCEQDAMVAYMNEFGGEKIKILPHPSINSYIYSEYEEHKNIVNEEDGNWHEGNLLLHLPGIGMERRLEILKSTKVTQ